MASSDTPAAADPEVLNAIADSVRGSFQTVEDMTQSFIREAIVQGAFPPGQRLNLDAIAATLGVSRMPVRASLRQLESEGLLKIHAYRGATVSVLGADEIAEIYEMRILLETYLLRHAMESIDDELIERLQVIVDDLEGATELGPRLDLRRSFYNTIYERANRPRALAQANHLRSAVGRYLLLQQVDEHPVHSEFFVFLTNHDLDNAEEWLTSHLSRVSSRLQEMVRQTDPAPQAS